MKSLISRREVISMAAVVALGQREPPLPHYTAPRRDSFKLDGDLNKPVWKGVPAVKLVSATGRKAQLQPTILRVCWSDTHLYLGFHCKDSEIKSSFTKRDEPLYEADVVETFLCPDGDLHRYFEIEFSPNEVLWDGKLTNPNLRAEGIQADIRWDCEGLECKAHKHGFGGTIGSSSSWWSVEAGIPFAGLGLNAPSVGAEWRANFYRIDYNSPTEFSSWSPTLAYPAAYHVPTRFGFLRFAA